MKMQRGHVNAINKGYAAIEMVLVLPIFLLLLAAMIDMGRAFFQHIELDKRQRNAALYLARHLQEDSNNKADITSAEALAAISKAKNLILTGGDEPPSLPGLSADNITVTAMEDYKISVSTTYTYQSLGIFALEFTDPITLTTMAIARITE